MPYNYISFPVYLSTGLQPFQSDVLPLFYKVRAFFIKTSFISRNFMTPYTLLIQNLYVILYIFPSLSATPEQCKILIIKRKHKNTSVYINKFSLQKRYLLHASLHHVVLMQCVHNVMVQVHAVASLIIRVILMKVVVQSVCSALIVQLTKPVFVINVKIRVLECVVSLLSVLL